MTHEVADLCVNGNYTKAADAAVHELQKSVALLLNADECNVCRIVEIIHQHNLRFVITGDSMMLQTFSGFWCKLSWRGYVVQENTTYHTFHPLAIGIQGFTELTISGPAHWESPTKVIFISQYAPKPNMSKMADVALTANMLLMNFGLHWSWSGRQKYQAAMANVLNATKYGNIQLQAYWETSAQHFHGMAGEWDKATTNSSCFPWPKDSTRSHQFCWRENIVQGTAIKLGYRVVVAGDDVHESLPSVAQHHDENELVILPFYNFTSQLLII